MQPKSHKVYSRLPFIRPIRSAQRFCVFLASSLFGTVPLQSQNIEYATLGQLIEQGTQSFANGNYANAAAAFGNIQALYSLEPEWTEGYLPRKLLPLTGFAALKAGFYEQSIGAFELFLDEYADNYSQKSFSEYALALALKQQGKPTAAIEQFARFRANTQSPSHEAIAGIQEAALLVESGKSEAALELLVDLASGERADRTKVQARLAAIRYAIDSAQLERASSLLLEHQWQTDAMPELAMLSFLAFEIGDYLLANDRPQEAIATYRLVLPRDRLIQLQHAKLEALKDRYRERRKSLKLLVNLWDEFYRQIIHSLETQLSSLEAASDYSESLALRKGQAYLKAQRPREAWLVFERLAKEASPEVAAQAQYLWISAAREANMLRDAIAIARDYIRKYPAHSESLRTLYLLGILLQEENRLEDAILAFSEVIQHPNGADLIPPALFNRAYCFANLNRYGEARSDFSLIIAEHPQSPLASNAAIWQGLTHFFEGDYTAALDHFNAIKANLPEPGHQAELLYRIACSQFALGDYPMAQRSCEAYLQKHKQHIRESEVALLLGDARAAQSDFIEATKAYSRVDRESIDLYHHATLETAHCYVQVEDPRTALNTLENYAQNAPIHLAADAYHAQIAIYRKSGEPDRAYAKLTQALDRLGNATAATGLPQCLSELQHDQSYPQFLETQLEAAPNGSTRKARLQLAQALYLRDTLQPYQSEVILLQIAAQYDHANLPQECLAYVGLKLAEIQSEQAKEALDLLLKRYPNSEYATFAYYAFALIAERSNDHPTTLAWLARIPDSAYQAPFYIDALLLQADVLRQNGEMLRANDLYESILSLRWASGNHKATALAGLAANATAQGKLEESIVYHQRIYTLYPAYKKIAAHSYLRSAELFQTLDDPQSVYQTCREFLRQERFATSEHYSKMQALLDHAEAALLDQPQETPPS